MKKIVITLVIAICTICQIKAVDFSDDRGITASALFGCYHSHVKITYGVLSEFNEYYPVITPRIGYRFNSSWEAGIFYRYEGSMGDYNEHPHYSGIGAYGEWSFFRFLRGFRLIAEAHVLYNFFVGDSDFNGSSNMTEVGMIPCIAYRIPHTPVDIKLRYLFLGFNNSHRYYKAHAPGCRGRGDWIIDASLRRLEIGASITF